MLNTSMLHEGQMYRVVYDSEHLTPHTFTLKFLHDDEGLLFWRCGRKDIAIRRDRIRQVFKTSAKTAITPRKVETETRIF